MLLMLNFALARHITLRVTRKEENKCRLHPEVFIVTLTVLNNSQKANKLQPLDTSGGYFKLFLLHS